MTIRYEESMAEVRAKQAEVAEIKAKLAKMEQEMQKTKDYIDRLRN